MYYYYYKINTFFEMLIIKLVHRIRSTTIPSKGKKSEKSRRTFGVWCGNRSCPRKKLVLHSKSYTDRLRQMNGGISTDQSH